MAQAPTTVEPDTIEQVLVRGAYFGKRVAAGAKTPTPLMDVPQSVSLMSAEQINDQALTSIAQVMQYTPGVSIGQGEDHRDQITIRGQNTTADFFIDGLRDDVQYFRPLYNLERVEVLRGANALLFGRGGGGGVVNRVTKVADTTESFTDLAGGLDTFGAQLVTVDSNLQLSDSQALRLNGMVEAIDNHRDFKDGNRWAVNPTYTANLSDTTQFVAAWERVDDERVVDRGNPSVNGQPLAGNRDTFFGSPTLNETTFRGDVLRLRADHRLSSDWSLNATLQYADYDKYYQNLYPIGFDEQATTVSLDGYRDTTKRENSLAQFNAIGQFSTAGVAHTLLAGAEVGRQKTANARRDAFFDASQDDQITVAFSRVLDIPTVGFPQIVRDRASDVTFRSIFLQDELALNDQWSVIAGVRWDEFEIDVRDTMAANSGSDGKLSRRDREISPRAGIIFKPTPMLSLYASYSVSFLPRSGDQFLTLTPSTATLSPEEFENLEAGVKWSASSNLNVMAAVFEITRDNGTAVDPNNPERSVLTGTETRGLELQLVGNLTDQLSLNASYTYLDGTELGRFVDGNAANRDLAQLPANKLTLWGDWTVTSAWRIGMGVVYQDEQYTSLSNAVTLPAFTRVDAAVFWDVSDDLSLQLNVENVLDENYYPAAHNDNNITTGRPLNARLTARYHW
jgi:catecholate siderophore receptor